MAYGNIGSIFADGQQNETGVGILGGLCLYHRYQELQEWLSSVSFVLSDQCEREERGVLLVQLRSIAAILQSYFHGPDCSLQMLCVEAATRILNTRAATYIRPFTDLDTLYVTCVVLQNPLARVRAGTNGVNLD